MALAGNELDLYVRKYTDMIEHELQQHGSVLENAVTLESGVMGERTYFNRIGAVDSIEELSSRFDPITLDQASFERRFVTPQTLHKALGLDKLDLIRMAGSPQSDIVTAMVDGMGRKKDSVLLAAFGASALREVAGSSSNIAFTAGNTIAQDTNTYTSLTSDTALHEGKLQLAIRILQGNHVDMGRDEVFVIATAKQLANLRNRVLTLGYGRKDFFNKTPLTIPGLDQGLDGLFGCRFIAFEQLADTDQLVGGDEYAYVLVRSAVKLGVWEPLSVRVSEREDLKGAPLQMVTRMSLGAVRMDEKKIVRIECDV